MTRPVRLLIPCLWLAACQSVPPQPEGWADFLGRVDRMDASQLDLARQTAIGDYALHPTDANRLRAAYLLSRPEASTDRLAQSQEMLGGIADGSDLAPMRDLLRGEIRKSLEVQVTVQRAQELEAQLAELKRRVSELQTQLDALKNIEQEMADSQHSAEDIRQ